MKHLFSLTPVRALLLTTLVASVVAVPMSAAPASSPDVTWTIGTPMPFAATRFDGQYVNGRVYILGFRDVNNNTDGSVWFYNVATQSWTNTGTTMPVPISNYQIAMLRDENGVGLYTFGGRDATGAIITTVQAYYPATNTTAEIFTDPWPGTSPSGCVSLPAMGVAVVSNHAIVMGGASFSSSGCAVDDNSAQTWIYNPASPAGSRWLRGPDLTLARGYITPAVLGTRIYAIGGDINVAGTLTAQNKVEVWNAPGGGWNDAAADLPEACDESQAFGFTAGPLARQIVLAGCGQWPNALADSFIYDAVANIWTATTPLNVARRNHAGAVIGSGTNTMMWVAGGYASDGFTALDSTEMSPPTPSGRPAPGLITPRHATGQAPNN